MRTRNKQIKIGLERTINTRTVQHFDKVTPWIHDAPTSETIEEISYEIVRLVNAAVINWDFGMRLTIGTMLDEKQADSLARCKTFEVTITK